jgi:hypothetical protein
MNIMHVEIAALFHEGCGSSFYPARLEPIEDVHIHLSRLRRNEFKEYRGAIACFVRGTVLTASGVPRNVNEPGYGETQESASVW